MTDTIPYSTIAARVPLDLREGLEALATREGHGDLSTTIRRLLREGLDAELANGRGRLFDARQGAARKADRPTAKRAARLVAPRAGSQRRRALEHFAAVAQWWIAHPLDRRPGRDGLTTDEVIAREQALGRDVAVNGFARRVTDLLEAGAIESVVVAGEYVTRKTRHGSDAQVWRITAKGRRWLAETEVEK